MANRLVALIPEEGAWLTASRVLALLAAVIAYDRWRNAALSTARRVLVALYLFFGVTIGTMAFGHLLAVATKLSLGMLESSSPVFSAPRQ